MHIGAHEPSKGGLHRAVERAVEDGCESLQIFVKGNTRWQQRPWTDAEADRWATALAGSGLHGVQAHTSYLINLATDKPEVADKSHAALADELNRCRQLGVPFLVMHPGAHLGQGEEEGLRLIASRLNALYATAEAAAWNTTLLFEITAGQGSHLGYELEHFSALFDQLDQPERFGVCFDTCHAHAAGYDLTTPELYEEFWEVFDSLVGLERLRTFHLNDSVAPLGSRVDRHAHIGEGEIGLETFRLLVNDPRFSDHIASLETPAIDKNDSGYAKNLAVLKSLRE